MTRSELKSRIKRIRQRVPNIDVWYGDYGYSARAGYAGIGGTIVYQCPRADIGQIEINPSAEAIIATLKNLPDKATA